MQTNENNNMQFCVNCGQAFFRNAPACPRCGSPNPLMQLNYQMQKQKDDPMLWIPTLLIPIFFIASKNRARAWTARILVVLGIVMIIAGSQNTTTQATGNNQPTQVEVTTKNKNTSQPAKVEVSNKEQSTPKTVAKKNSYADKFSGDCGISATAKMGRDIIGQPTISIDIINNSSKTIAAIQFYFIPLDVYGEERKGIFAQNRLSSNKSINVQESVSGTWQFLDQHVKKGKLLVYSVYFEDGTEWGDRNASDSSARKYGKAIEVIGTSN